MAKITRTTAQLFAISGAGTDVEQFASFEINGVPTYTINPATIMALPAWTLGWSSTQFDGTFAPYFQDRNAVDLVSFYQLAYLLQQGIAEWDTATSYFIDSVVQNGGSLYLSQQDNNTGNAPPAGASNSFWTILAFPSTNPAKNPTRTVLTSAFGTYTPPAGCLRIVVRMVGGGGGGAGSNFSISPQYVAGSSGGSSSLGSYSCGGGGGGATSGGYSTGGVGGTASGGNVNISGSRGIDGFTPFNAGLYFSGMSVGGPSVFGGAGAGILPIASPGQPGISASPNSGSGGGGGCDKITGGGTGEPGAGAGGGSGAFLQVVIQNPIAVAYVVGAGGAGGSAQYPGGNGAAGIIIVDEFYY